MTETEQDYRTISHLLNESGKCTCIESHLVDFYVNKTTSKIMTVFKGNPYGYLYGLFPNFETAIFNILSPIGADFNEDMLKTITNFMDGNPPKVKSLCAQAVEFVRVVLAVASSKNEEAYLPSIRLWMSQISGIGQNLQRKVSCWFIAKALQYFTLHDAITTAGIQFEPDSLLPEPNPDQRNFLQDQLLFEMTCLAQFMPNDCLLCLSGARVQQDVVTVLIDLDKRPITLCE